MVLTWTKTPVGRARSRLNHRESCCTTVLIESRIQLALDGRSDDLAFNPTERSRRLIFLTKGEMDRAFCSNSDKKPSLMLQP
jgi:hypothetical protein